MRLTRPRLFRVWVCACHDPASVNTVAEGAQIQRCFSSQFNLSRQIQIDGASAPIHVSQFDPGSLLGALGIRIRTAHVINRFANACSDLHLVARGCILTAGNNGPVSIPICQCDPVAGDVVDVQCYRCQQGPIDTFGFTPGGKD